MRLTLPLTLLFAGTILALPEPVVEATKSKSISTVPTSCSAVTATATASTDQCGSYGKLKNPAYLGSVQTASSTGACAAICETTYQCTAFSYATSEFNIDKNFGLRTKRIISSKAMSTLLQTPDKDGPRGSNGVLLTGILQC